MSARGGCVCGHRESAHRTETLWRGDGERIMALPVFIVASAITPMSVPVVRHTGRCEYVDFLGEPDVRDAFGIVRLGRSVEVACRCARYNPKTPISMQRSFDLETRTWLAADVLPACPGCGADELYIDPGRGNARCYVCPFDDWAVRA